ncbi:MAG: hypothetical protein R3B90_04890 [Planctomycetaceae bacterium]
MKYVSIAGKLSLLGGCWVAGGMPVALADDAPPAAEVDNEVETPVEAVPGSLRPLQPADAPIAPLSPKHPRSADERQMLDALAHYMTGQFYLQRGEIKYVEIALDELEKSIELNPRAIDAYRLYVPIALREKRDEQARKYAILATVNGRWRAAPSRPCGCGCRSGATDSAIQTIEQRLPGLELAELSFARLIPCSDTWPSLAHRQPQEVMRSPSPPERCRPVTSNFSGNRTAAALRRQAAALRRWVRPSSKPIA